MMSLIGVGYIFFLRSISFLANRIIFTYCPSYDDSFFITIFLVGILKGGGKIVIFFRYTTHISWNISCLNDDCLLWSIASTQVWDNSVGLMNYEEKYILSSLWIGNNYSIVRKFVILWVQFSAHIMSPLTPFQRVQHQYMLEVSLISHATSIFTLTLVHRT